MLKKGPLFLMLMVLAAPFVVSIAVLQDRSDLKNSAQGEWLSETIHVDASEQRQWQLLWRKQDCQISCDEYEGLLQRLKMALGKHQDKLQLIQTEQALLRQKEKGLFVANASGLVLLAYEPSEKGAYKLLKDLKVLIKHGGA